MFSLLWLAYEWNVFILKDGRIVNFATTIYLSNRQLLVWNSIPFSNIIGFEYQLAFTLSFELGANLMVFLRLLYVFNGNDPFGLWIRWNEEIERQARERKPTFYLLLPTHRNEATVIRQKLHQPRTWLVCFASMCVSSAQVPNYYVILNIVFFFLFFQQFKNKQTDAKAQHNFIHNKKCWICNDPNKFK